MHRLEIVEAYLDRGATTTARQGDGQVPLYYVRRVSKPHYHECLASLLKARPIGCPEIDSIDINGRTPLFNCLDTPDCVKLPLDWGANVGIADSLGRTVLHLACANDDAELLSLLLDHATVENKSNTPLFLAFKNGSIGCTKLLLQRTHVLRTVDRSGWIVLHKAVKMGDEYYVSLALTIPKLDCAARTPGGQTTWDLALTRHTVHRSRRILLILARAGAPFQAPKDERF
jgi:ankyrin repeat protein